MSIEDELVELSNVYHGTEQYVKDLEEIMRDSATKIATLEDIINGLFEIAPASPTKIALWRRYQNLKPRKPPVEPLEGMSGI